MGTCYTAILLDEFNWDYVNDSQSQREEIINNFLKDRGRGGAVISSFPNGIIVSLEKDSPEYGELNAFLLNNADIVMFYNDNCVWNIKKLETAIA